MNHSTRPLSALFRGLARVPTVVLPALLLTTPIAAQRPFTAADMLDVVQISGAVAVSPDGTRLAFVLPDLREAGK